MPAGAADPVAALLAAFARRRPRRAGSLIVTVFGDAILPRGGAVQLADLMTLLAAFKLKKGKCGRRCRASSPMAGSRRSGAGGGGGAYALARTIYHGLAPAAEGWIDHHLQSVDEPLPKPEPDWRRFSLNVPHATGAGAGWGTAEVAADAGGVSRR
jgi:hypothetical protein